MEIWRTAESTCNRTGPFSVEKYDNELNCPIFRGLQNTVESTGKQDLGILSVWTVSSSFRKLDILGV